MKKKNLLVGKKSNKYGEEVFSGKPLTNIFNKPFQLLLIITFSIFVAETIVMFLLRALPPFPRSGEAFVDSLLLTSIILPVLYYLIYKPLKMHINERNKTEDALRLSEQRFKDIAENALEWIWEVDSEGKYTYVSPVVEQILGYHPQEIVGKHFYDLFHPEDRAEFKTAALEVFASKKSFSDFLNRNIHKKGHTVWLSTSGIPILDAEGKLTGYRGADTDITERKLAEDRILESEKRFKDVTANTGDWIWETDTQGRYTYSSPVVENILGYKPEEVVGRYVFDFLHPDERNKIKDAVHEAFSRKEAFRNVLNNKVHKKGQIVICETSGVPILSTKGELCGYRGAVRDVSDHKIMEKKLKEAAITDELTGLLNRRGFYMLSEQQCKIANRNQKQVSLLYADLDNLKIINDELGHRLGDQALVDIARVLKEICRESDIIGRIGGDEFAILLPDASDPAVMNIIIGHVQDELRSLNRQRKRSYELSLSIGCAQYNPKSPCTLDELLVEADKLMYAEKGLKKK